MNPRLGLLGALIAAGGVRVSPVVIEDDDYVYCEYAGPAPGPPLYHAEHVAMVETPKVLTKRQRRRLRATPTTGGAGR